MKIINDTQMELTLNQFRHYSPRRGQRRTSRAAWWFRRMREVVDSAFDRQPEMQARPEQILLPTERRREYPGRN